MKKAFLILSFCISLFFMMGCDKTTSQSDKIEVYTSFYTMYDFASAVGGDACEVHNMCPPGQEPHDYEPTPRDMAKLSQADVFIYNGLGMEHWVADVLEIIGENTIVVNTSEYANTSNQDPHIWLNPENAYIQMEAICNALILADAENKQYYTNNLATLKASIDSLLTDYTTATSDFKSNTIVVSHNAYQSLCDRFGLTQVPINGFSNSQDPTPSDIAKIEKIIEDKGITHIFKEPLGTSSIVEAIAKDTNTKILVLDPFEGNANGKNYFTIMYENLENLKIALN